MRNFDNWDTYKDLNGNTLHGCVQFNVRGGTTPGHIYDRDGTEIANPQLTDSLGRTVLQVFVDSDVVAYFYKYIGNGSYSVDEEIPVDTSDESLWSLQYTVESKLSVDGTVTSNAAMGVSTMSSLRGLNPEEVPLVDGLRIVCLQGYYEGGDCSPVWYVWNPNATADDDNGSVIKYSGLLTGRWILVRPDGFVDSRHFGVFPQDSQLADVDHTTRITQLVSYCNTAGLNPLFGGSASHPYFIYNSLNVNSRNAISVSRGTAFVDKSDSYFYGDWDGDPLFVNGRTKVSAHTVRASWNFSDAITYDEVFLDAQTPKDAFVDARVVVTVDTAGKTFTNCELVSDGHLAENTFHNCVLRAPMFVTQDISPTIDADCTIQPLDFADRMKLWCILRSQVPYPVVDVCMQTLDASCELSLDGIFIKNALFDGFRHEATVSLGLESCRGSITVVANGNYVLTAEDSEIVLTTEGTSEAGLGYQPSFNLRNCTFGMQTQLTYLTSLGAVGSELSTGGILCGTAALDSCSVSSALTVRGDLTVRKCTLSSDIVHYAITSPAKVEMVGNVLNAYYRLSAATANTLVNAVWSGNYSSVTSPIVIDRTNLDPIDSHHTYVYSDNSGGFLPYTTPREIHEFTIHHVSWASQWLTEPYTLIQTTLGNTASSGEYCWFGKMIPHYDMQHHFDTVEMFRLGVDRFRINARLTDVGSTLMNSGSDYEYSMNVPVEAGLGAYFVSGNTFCIRPWFDDPTAESENLSYNGVSPVIMKGSRSFGGNESPSFTDYHVYLGIEYECMDKHGR